MDLSVSVFSLAMGEKIITDICFSHWRFRVWLFLLLTIKLQHFPLQRFLEPSCMTWRRNSATSRLIYHIVDHINVPQYVTYCTLQNIAYLAFQCQFPYSRFPFLSPKRQAKNVISTDPDKYPAFCCPPASLVANKKIHCREPIFIPLFFLLSYRAQRGYLLYFPHVN